MRITKNRKTILDLLSRRKAPMSAELIYQELPKDTMNLSTIYRSLETLYSHGQIAKTMLNNTAFYNIIHKKHHHHYIICLHCQKMVKLDCYVHDVMNKIEAQSNFTVVQHDLTFYGYCPDCQP